MRILKKDPLLKLFNDMLVDYPSPSNISYLWNFGSLAAFCLIIQIVTGIVLAMHYTPHIDLAFSSVEHIMRDVNYGWLIRYTHANGASMFFLILYLHMLRGLYYGSYQYPRQLTWYVGVAILIITIMTGFMGYVLPWGQMSLWAATVITNLLSAIPYIGKDIVYWVWGGFSVDNATLNRFFSLHYLLPFVLAALAGVHLIALHNTLSGNPLGVNSKVDMIPFHPYFTAKDIFGVVLLLVLFAILVFFQPNLLGEPDNYIPANPMSTPPHIVPDWYFLPFYTMLRSIPNKLGGVICMGSALLIYFVLPLLSTSEIRSAAFRPIFRKVYWIFVANILILGWIGGIPVQQPFILIGQVATALYFITLLIILPVVGLLENKLLAHQE